MLRELVDAWAKAQKLNYREMAKRMNLDYQATCRFFRGQAISQTAMLKVLNWVFKEAK